MDGSTPTPTLAGFACFPDSSSSCAYTLRVVLDLAAEIARFLKHRLARNLPVAFLLGVPGAADQIRRFMA